MAIAGDKFWVWRSTPRSRRQRSLSVLSVVETVFCVSLYWLLWKWLGITWHHWVIVVATPLVLLRSEESVKLGAKLIDDFIISSPTPDSNSPSNMEIVLGVCWGLVVALFVEFALQSVTTLQTKFALSAMLGWVAANLIVAFVSAISRTAFSGKSAHTGASATLSLVLSFPIVFLYFSDTLSIAISSILGFSLGIVVVIFCTRFLMKRPNANYAFSLQILLSPYAGYVLGIVLRAILTRSYATLRNLHRGLVRLPNNWSYNVYVSDLWDPPELVPGSKKLHFYKILKKIQGQGGHRREPQWILGGLITVLVVFLPAVFWRWAIKSTAWFYLPLLFVARRGMSIDDGTRVILAKTYTRKLMSIIGLVASVSFLVSALLAIFRPDWLAELAVKTKIEGAPLPPLAYILVLDWRLIWNQPWQIAYLFSAAISIYVFYRYDEIGKNLHAGMPEIRHYAELRFIQRLGNVSLLLTICGLSWALIVFSNAVWGSSPLIFR